MKAFKFMLVLILAFIPFSSALAAEPKTFDHYIPMDIDEEFWAFEEIDDFINADIIDGYMDEDLNMTVQPDNKVTRAQFTKILVNALGLKSEGTAKTFSDVKAGEWYYDYVNTASSLGIIQGKADGTFAPNAKITRDQMTKMIVVAFEKTIAFPEGTTQKFPDVNDQYWAFDYVNKASETGIVKGKETGLFQPRDFASRAQAVVMIHRALQQEKAVVTSEEEVTGFLKDHITRENRLTETNSYDELVKLYEENGTGYFKVEMVELGGGQFAPAEGEEFSAVIDDTNLSLNVLSLSDRYATVEVKGMTGTFVFKSEDFNMDFKTALDGVYKLKKDAVSGEWKIYYYMPYFEEELLEEMYTEEEYAE